VLFALNDPYQRGLPFHRSAAFMVLPPEVRWQCVWRNPKVPLLVQSASDGICQLARLSGTGPLAVADGEVTKGFDAITKLEDTFGVECLWHDGNGRLIAPPKFTLAYSWLAEPGFGGRTVRERRRFRGGLVTRLGKLTWRARRAPSMAYLSTALAVWDAREGWTGAPRFETLGYDPDRALTLREALRRAKATPEQYYRAFQYVTGHEYSAAAAWVVALGWLWQERQHFASVKRRNSGWRKGAPRTREHRAIADFFRLVRQGTEIEVAVQVARLSPGAARVLSAPENRDQVSSFVANPEAVQELLARL
jgi:hypothetical protein